jgi:hypothetical protein
LDVLLSGLDSEANRMLRHRGLLSRMIRLMIERMDLSTNGRAPEGEYRDRRANWKLCFQVCVFYS